MVISDFSKLLEKSYNANPDYFGLTVGLSVVWGASKDKILESAGDVATTAKKMMRGGGEPNKVAHSSGVTKSFGRSGKQTRLKELARDDKRGKSDKGWLRQELRSIETKSKSMRSTSKNGYNE